MTDELKLLGLLTPLDPATPEIAASAEMQAAAETLAANLQHGTIGLFLGESDRGALAALAISMSRWSAIVAGMEEALRVPSRRERRGWWRRITWRVA